MSKRKKLEKRILSLFSQVDKPLTLAETSQHLGESTKDVYKALRHLFENEKIYTVEGRRYKLSSSNSGST
jgi:predicted Zn-ribbon and HTH transcriptional regulator